jgi:hypothetical protein
VTSEDRVSDLRWAGTNGGAISKVVREHHKAGGAAMVDVLMFLAFGIGVGTCLSLIDRAVKGEDD